MAEVRKPASLLTVRGIVIGVICIVAANILLELLRRMIDLPFSDSLESMLATGVGVLVWFGIVARLSR
jgi:hypothetical protein